jgi:hypothetical protein
MMGCQAFAMFSTVTSMGGGAAYHDIRGHGCNQKEDMGLLEYQAMPSMRDIADVVVCVHVVMYQQLQQLGLLGAQS